MPYIILDRDGVINYDSIEYIKSPEEWQAIPGSLEAIAKLNHANYQVLVVTNQSGIGRGYYDQKTLESIHEKMLMELAEVKGHVEEIFFCPHHPNDDCSCRKPKAGMLYQIAAKYPLELPKTFFIGDSLSDVKAGLTAGCIPLLVRTGNGELALSRHPELSVIPNFRDLAEAVDYVLEKNLA